MLICSIKDMTDESRNDITDECESPELKTLIEQCLQNGVQCAVLAVECYMEDTSEYNYYNIAFTNNVIVTAVSGIFLSGIDAWED